MNSSMEDKIILITGANSGIGKSTALALAAMGGELILVTRQAGSGAEARKEIQEQTGSDKIHQYTCDLASLAQVRSLAADLHRDFERIDVLINNAGIITRDRQLTEDGFEYQFGVNHLAHFLLTQLLVDLLRKSKAARIINLSSVAHKSGKIHYSDLSLEKGYAPMKAYSQSKLANIIFTYGLCDRLSNEGITSNAVHPGIVGSRFGFGRNGRATQWFMKLYQKLAKPPKKGAETVIFLASSPGLEQKSGGYYVNKKAVPSSKSSYDPDASTALWNLSLKMCGLSESLI